jgi:hypothetical protein
MARRAGLPESEFYRFLVDTGLRSVRRHTRGWLINQLNERRNNEKSRKIEGYKLRLIAGGLKESGDPAHESEPKGGDCYGLMAE